MDVLGISPNADMSWHVPTPRLSQSECIPVFDAKDVDVLGDVSVGDPYVRQGSCKL